MYVPVTAADGVILGATLCQHADDNELTEGYREFKEEVSDKFPECPVHSVNVDGWDGTSKAWSSLFPGITVIRCFLHVVLGIQERCRSDKKLYKRLSDALWNLYRSLNPAEFGQRLRRLIEWTVSEDSEVPEAIQLKLIKLKNLESNLKQTFRNPDAKRTSNAVDRMMNYQDRILYGMQYFHGSEAAAKQALRAMAILWNFHPYVPKVQARAPHGKSPFEALNGFQYHEHWVRNMLIAGSMNGRNAGDFVPNKIR